MKTTKLIPEYERTDLDEAREIIKQTLLDPDSNPKLIDIIKHYELNKEIRNNEKYECFFSKNVYVYGYKLSSPYRDLYEEVKKELGITWEIE